MKYKMFCFALFLSCICFQACGIDDQMTKPIEEQKTEENAVIPTVYDNQDESGTKKDSGSTIDENKLEKKKIEREGYISIGIINTDPNESKYRKKNDKELRKWFTKKNGYKAKFVNVINSQTQRDSADKFVDEGVEYLVINASDSMGWETVLQKAKSADIKVLFFDCFVDADQDLYDVLIRSESGNDGQSGPKYASYIDEAIKKLEEGNSFPDKLITIK